jgi:hypothetical protein
MMFGIRSFYYIFSSSHSSLNPLCQTEGELLILYLAVFRSLIFVPRILIPKVQTPELHSSLRSAVSGLHLPCQCYVRVKLHSPRQTRSCRVKLHPWCVKTASSLITPHQAQFCRVKPAAKLTCASILFSVTSRPRQTTSASHSCYMALDSVYSDNLLTYRVKSLLQYSNLSSCNLFQLYASAQLVLLGIFMGFLN